MQNSSRLQPLTLSHVVRQEEPWSSDSDSGITVDSQSPPSKVTPDSGVCCDSLPWNLSTSHPSDITPGPGMSGTEGAVKAVMPGHISHAQEAETERQRQQDYVRSTLLQYERQKQLQQERGEGGGRLYSTDLDPHSFPSSLTQSGSWYDSDRQPDHAPHSARGGTNDYRGGANDYIPSQLMRKPGQADPHDNEMSDRTPKDLQHVSYQELNERFKARDFLPPGSDEGYGTDSRSLTTSSPLSSSLSSLTTDSSSSLNGSQRGLGGVVGNGSGKGQPVASGGRLVVGKRGMLVKRRDLPTVERTDCVTLEDRLRALTTIEEEDSAMGHNSKTQGSVTQSTVTNPNTSRPSILKIQRTDTRWKDTDSRTSRSGSGVSGEGQTYPEGLYSVIRKPSDRAGSGSRGGGDGQSSERGESTSPGLHRAVPVRVEPEGAAYFPSKAPSRDPAGQGDGGGDGDNSGGGGGGNSYGRPGDSRSEVRFKAGGGGVKLNTSGQFEIDYSYYMKASPSESNDDVNTYSPTSTRAQFGEVFSDRAGESAPSRRWAGHPDQQNYTQAEEDSSYPRDFNPHLHNTGDLPPAATDSPSQGHYQGYRGQGSPQGQENFAEETEQIYMNIGPQGLGPREDNVMCSMPNLSVHAPPPTRMRSGDTGHVDPVRRSQESGVPSSVLRRPHTLGKSCPPSGRLTGQGDRNSCDVGSLYRQTELCHTFPPSQGVAADRMSLNLGDLPKIQEQLRATSEMLLSSGKRHQFASSSDIYRLFQGQQGQASTGFPQGRQPPHRHSFHTMTSPPLHSLADVRSRVKANSVMATSARAGTDPSASGTSSGFTSGPVRANHNICVSSSAGYSSPRNQAHARKTYTETASEKEARLKERLDRGQHFATDVIQGDEGEQLSTLV